MLLNFSEKVAGAIKYKKKKILLVQTVEDIFSFEYFVPFKVRAL